MDSQVWRRVRSIFEEAVELHGAERESFLVRACGADGALRSEVDALLQADVSSDGFTHFIDSGIVGELVGGRLASSIDGARIGTYRVNRVIATGGMGTVYEATQENPTRTVALKMMRAGLESPDAVRRFRYECETLARLRHPGIAQIYEAGVYRVAGREEPLPFFAMEYVEDARTLIDFVQSHRLSTHAALELFLAICEAVNDAHQKGVIHRDLKPANILVDAAGRPKIIDFGIARTVTTDAPAQTLETQAGQIVGTVQYMSPEQAEGSREDVDTRSDVYSLGAILFQMLSGRLPYYLENCSITDVVRIVRNEPPIRLGSLVPSLAGDLEWITLKALEKEKARRYESAAALADDVRRHLRNEPVIAGPPSAVYRLRKFVRRHRVAVAAATTVVVALVAGIVATSLALRRAVRAEATARTAKDRAEQSLKRASGALDFLTETFRAADPDKSGRDVRVADRLAAAAADVGKRFADDPATEASIREAIGNTYVGLGLFREAEAELRHALERWDAVTATTEDVRGARIVTALDLGTALDSEDRLDEAEALDRRTLDESRAVLGPNDETTLTLAGNLAVVLKKSKKFEESEALYRETLATSARVLGDDDSLTLTLATNLSTLLLMKEDHAEGEAMLRQTLEKLKRRYGESDLQTLTAMHSLANLLREDGKLTEAERLARTIVERLSQVLGDTHRDTLLATVTLAEILEKQGRQDEAIEIRRRTLDRQIQTLGETHSDVRDNRRSLALALRIAGRLAEAEPFARALYADTTAIPPVVRTNDANILALVLSEQGKTAEAEPLFVEALEGMRAITQSDDSPRVLQLQVNLADCWVRAKRYAEAEELLGRIWDAVVRAFGEKTVFPQKAARNLVAIYDATNRPDLAANWRAKLVPSAK